MIAFPHRPFEPESHNLPEHAIEVVWDLTGEKPAIFREKFSSRLEIVRHIERAPGVVPVRGANGVVPNGIQQIFSPLPFLFQSARDRWPVQQAVRRSMIAGNLPKLGDRSVTQCIVPGAGVDPRICFIRGETHGRAPRTEKRGDTLNVREAPLTHLCPDGQTRLLELNHLRR